MNDKRIPIETEEPKHRKKSQKKKAIRSDHKHEYKTVLLITESESIMFPGRPDIYERPTRVCTICGRVGHVDLDQYDHVEMPDMPYRICQRVIRNKDSLEKWKTDDYFDKFARRIDSSV